MAVLLPQRPNLQYRNLQHPNLRLRQRAQISGTRAKGKKRPWTRAKQATQAPPGKPARPKPKQQSEQGNRALPFQLRRILLRKRRGLPRVQSATHFMQWA